MRRMSQFRARVLLKTVVMAQLIALPGSAVALDAGETGRRLVVAYPEAIEKADGNWLVFRDGTKLAIDDGKPSKTPEDILADPDLNDIFAWDYPAGAEPAAPPELADPGRARPHAFFAKLYGDCTRGESEQHFVDVVWLPKKAKQKLRMTSRNGAAAALARVSAELDLFPPTFDVYLKPSAGTYNCRTIAGTGRPSAHGYGIAIDISIEKADYWRWSDKGASSAVRWRNRIPVDIVTVFEKHGFIWGGRWHHYDTMHFEYRPELLLALSK